MRGKGSTSKRPRWEGRKGEMREGKGEKRGGEELALPVKNSSRFADHASSMNLVVLFVFSHVRLLAFLLTNKIMKMIRENNFMQKWHLLSYRVKD